MARPSSPGDDVAVVDVVDMHPLYNPVHGRGGVPGLRADSGALSAECIEEESQVSGMAARRGAKLR